MTYEQASPRGPAGAGAKTDVLTFFKEVVAPLHLGCHNRGPAGRNREALLRYYLRVPPSAVQEGRKGAVREYLHSPGADPSRLSVSLPLLLAAGRRGGASTSR